MKVPWLLACTLAASSLGSALASEFRDTQYGYAISPPEFSAVSPGAQAARLTVLAPPEAGFAANMGVLVQEIKTTRDDYIALSEKQFKAAGMTVRSSSNREVSGRPAVVLDYEGQMGGHAMRFLSLAVVLRDRVLLVTCTAMLSAFPKHEKEFRRSLDSFRLESK